MSTPSVFPTAYQREQIEIIRRTAYRGKRTCEQGEVNCSDFIDLFIHLIDELRRLRDTYE